MTVSTVMTRFDRLNV